MTDLLQEFQKVYDEYIKPDKMLVINKKYEDMFVEIMRKSGHKLYRTTIKILELEGDVFGYWVDLKEIERICHQKLPQMT